MLDIRMLREDPEAVRAALARREPALAEVVDRILEMDGQRRKAETELQAHNAQRKSLSKEIGQRRGRGEDTAQTEAEVREIGQSIARMEETVRLVGEEQRKLLLETPNLPCPEIPDGSEAAHNREIRSWGEKKPTGGRDHLELAESLGIIDLPRAAKISGSGFVSYTGAGARLQRALIRFMLDLHTTRHGYLEVSPPFLIRRESMIGTGQLPKFEEDMYRLPDDELYLAPTAEVPLTNLYREEIVEDLPIKLTAHTPCFRREAGAAGKESRGLIRLHQFDKVELVRIVRPEESVAALEELTGEAEKVLQLLGLHYRVLDLCAGDLGFAAARTYDLEVWAPGQGAYLEVSSCSNFMDYQSRRMNLRFRGEDRKPRFCHTLNGSGTALPRLVVALLEEGQQPDGTVRLPEALHEYFGAEEIRAR